LENGYILIDSLTGSKYFIAEFNRFNILQEKYAFSDKNRDCWDKWKIEKAAESNWYWEAKKELSYYFRWKSQIRRNSQNFPKCMGPLPVMVIE